MYNFNLLYLLLFFITEFIFPIFSSSLSLGILNRTNSHDNIDDDKNNFELIIKTRGQRKSDIKCNEYHDMVIKKIWMLRPSESKPFSVSIPCKQPINLLISGGEAVEFGEFSHMAAIGWRMNDNTFEYFCGGSLIDKNWILTAAHCTHHRKKGKPSVVRLGSTRLSDKLGEILKIIDIIRHPKYEPPKLYSDIALLKLHVSVIFKNNIRPACLYSQYDQIPMAVWATGWGQTKYESENGTDNLMKVRLEIIDNIKCSLPYGKISRIPNGIAPSMFCAGDPHEESKKDTCKGDSGGPLQILHPSYCLYELVGITSFGKLCGVPKYPGVYTRISHYLDWIESIVWP